MTAQPAEHHPCPACGTPTRRRWCQPCARLIRTWRTTTPDHDDETRTSTMPTKRTQATKAAAATIRTIEHRAGVTLPPSAQRRVGYLLTHGWTSDELVTHTTSRLDHARDRAAVIVSRLFNTTRRKP